MRSNNPVFNRSPEFNGQRNAGAPYGGYQQPGQGYSDPSGWGVAQGGAPQQAPYKSSPMTIDTVVQKTAMSVGLTIVVALATYIALPPVTEEPSAIATAGAVAVVGSLVAFGLSMVNSFKRVISPGLVLAFAAVQGVALGGFTMVFGAFADGIIVPAVFGTFAAFAGTLAAYKLLNIRVGDKFRKGVVAAMFGMVGLSLISFVLSLFGVQTGLFGMGGLGMLTAVAGLVLGVFMLILDFDFVEQGVAAGLDERESWRAAFAMTVSLVWIYTNLLRLLAILNQD